MTKQEAIIKMKQGEKITHRFFSLEEWMTIDNGEILLEDGVRCSEDEFWKWRTDKSWDDGYEIYEP